MIRSTRSFLACSLLAASLAATPGRGTAPESAAMPAPGGRLDLVAQKTLRAPAGGQVAGLPPIQVRSTYFAVDSGGVDTKAVVASETFEGAFPGSVWTLFNLGVDAGWGKSTQRKSQGNRSGWCAQTGSAAPVPGGNVPHNMESWLVAGPFDLSAVTAGTLSFDLFLATEPGFDTLYVGASTDYPNFTLFGRNQNTSGFERFSVDLEDWGPLGDLTGENEVWFAFMYETDASISFEGAYLDRIELDVTTAAGLNLVINQVDGAACPSMRAFVSVTDGQGNPIQGLTAGNFGIEEDGVSRTLTAQPVSASGDALATALVLDGSGSLSSTDVANIKVAAKAFIDLLRTGDSVAVYHFGSDVTLVRDYTTNHNSAKAAVDALTNGLGNTSLYDAIVEAAQHSTTIGGRRALLVMTDGMNNDSIASEQDAIDAAVAAGVPVFTIGFGNVDAGVLERIADETGGLFFLGASSSDLAMIFNRISQTLGNQYVLSWTADEIDGGAHSLEVEVRRQGLTATKSTTYSQAGTPCASAGVCVADERTLCLNRGRFRVEVSWTNFTGGSGVGRVVPCGADDSGLFWFFQDDNWEMLVKVIDACTSASHRYWVFAAATTNVGYTLTVTDTQTGARKVYTNPLGVAAPAITDTTAFATCP